MQVINIKLTQLKAARVFASDETTRYYLNGVHLKTTDSGYTLQATDGHRLIMFMGEEIGGVMDIIIHKDTIDRIKIEKRVPDMVEIKIDGDMVELIYNGVTIKDKLVDGTFPNTARITPYKERMADVGAGIGINPAYLGDFAKVNKILGFPLAPIKMQFGGASESILVTNEHYKAVVMPTMV